MEIEKNVPLPPPYIGEGIAAALRTMDVGDSIFVVNGTSGSTRAHSVARETGAKFTRRKEGDGYRIWRIS